MTLRDLYSHFTVAEPELSAGDETPKASRGVGCGGVSVLRFRTSLF